MSSLEISIKISRPGLLPSIPRTVSTSVKESLLECWLQAVKTAGSSMDYRGLLMTYAQQLVRNRKFCPVLNITRLQYCSLYVLTSIARISGSLSKLSDVLNDLNQQGSVCGVLRSALKEDIEKIAASDPMTSSLVKQKDSGGLVFQLTVSSYLCIDLIFTRFVFFECTYRVFYSQVIYKVSL